MSDFPSRSSSLSFCEFFKRLACCRKPIKPLLKIDDDVIGSKLDKPILDLTGKIDIKKFSGGCAASSTSDVTRLITELSGREGSFSRRDPVIGLSLKNPVIIKELTAVKSPSSRKELATEFEQKPVQL